MDKEACNARVRGFGASDLRAAHIGPGSGGDLDTTLTSSVKRKVAFRSPT